MPAQTPLHDTLHEAGLRLTGQRRLLLEVLQEHGGHLDAHEVYRLARERDPHLNLSTVYRTLGLLRDLGLVDEQHLGEDHHHYELKTPATHYHLVCNVCGAVVEFTSPLIQDLETSVGHEYDYVISDAQVNLLGVCAACRAAAAAEPSLARPQPRVKPADGVIDRLRRSLRPAEDEKDDAPAAEGPASLRGLATGASAQVAALTGGHALVARLAALGLTPGAGLEVVQNPGRGPVIVRVRDTRLVLGRREAGYVLVAPAEAGDVS